MTTTPADKYHYKKLSGLTLALLIALLLDAGTTLAVMAGYIYTYNGFSSPNKPMTFTDMAGAVQGMDEIHHVEYAISLVALVLLLFWMHRAVANLLAWKTKGITYSPAWAVGWWFIPVANVYKPFAAMTEVWQASNPDTETDNWYSSRKNTALIVWWVCFLGGLWLYQFGHFALASTIQDVIKPVHTLVMPEGMLHGRICGMLIAVSTSFVLRILGALALALVVSTVSDNQTEKAEKLSPVAAVVATSAPSDASPTEASEKLSPEASETSSSNASQAEASSPESSEQSSTDS
ncbi:MAG TPA: DUF4328 domain-containing protein [Trichormus sp.]|jgi:hypothetical protein